MEGTVKPGSAGGIHEKNQVSPEDGAAPTQKVTLTTVEAF